MDENSSFPFILGTDFMSKNDITLTFSDGSAVCAIHTIHKTSSTQLSFDINTDLKKDESSKLHNLLKHEFPDCFTESNSLGRTHLVKHTIHLSDTIPHKVRPYRQPQILQPQIEQAINNMLAKGIIKESQLPWLSPFLLVKKRDGGFRFVVDYRKLNKKTISDCFPIPLIDDIFDRLRGAKYFSTLDLSSGFWQI